MTTTNPEQPEQPAGPKSIKDRWAEAEQPVEVIRGPLAEPVDNWIEP